MFLANTKKMRRSVPIVIVDGSVTPYRELSDDLISFYFFPYYGHQNCCRDLERLCKFQMCVIRRFNVRLHAYAFTFACHTIMPECISLSLSFSFIYYGLMNTKDHLFSILITSAHTCLNLLYCNHELEV